MLGFIKTILSVENNVTTGKNILYALVIPSGKRNHSKTKFFYFCRQKRERLLAGRFTTRICDSFNTMLILRILDYSNKLIKCHQISHNECLVIGIATSFTMDVATLKP